MPPELVVKLEDILHALMPRASAAEATCKESLRVRAKGACVVPRTVKHSLTVELVSNTYQFNSANCQLEASQSAGDFDQSVERIRKLEAPNPDRVRKGVKE